MLTQPPYANYPREFPSLSLFLDTRTDGKGKFVFERVPPITVEIYHEPKVRDRPMGTSPESQTTGLSLQPGETRHVTLGGKGRPVIGRLRVNGYDGEMNYRDDVQTLQTIVPQPPEMPDLTAMSQEFAAKIHSLDNEQARKAAMDEHQKQWEAAKEKLRDFYRTAPVRIIFSPNTVMP